jgi:hypothetical protein
VKVKRNRSRFDLYAPAIVLVFEAESFGPKCSWPQDPQQLARILNDLGDEWRELLERALGVAE